ncbi:MAG: M13 family metallopeptidase [Bdellovibrionales bacterium]|nr:M13 family metallopeptidase [Bdellovibrionales bacterium]
MLRFIRVLCLLLLVCIACTRKDSSQTCKTSAIPERRDFKVNENVNPCDNFYEYACSEALACFQLRDDRSRHIFAVNDSFERILEHKKSYLAKLGARTQLTPGAKALRNYYVACMDAPARKAEEIRLVQTTLKEIAPYKDASSFVKFVNSRIVGPHYAFLSFGRLSNLDNSEIYDVYFDSGPLMTLPERSYYEKPEVVADFTQLVEKFFTTIGLDKPSVRAKAVVEFEKNVAATYPLPAELRELFSKRLLVTREDLLKDYPSLYLAPALAKIPQKTQVRQLFAKNFSEVDKLLKATPVDILKDVYLFRDLSSYMDDAYPDYFQARFDFSHKHLGGPEVRPVRAERCSFSVMGDFAKELDRELIDELYSDFPTAKFAALVDRVRVAMVERLKKNQWLSARGKRGAIKKMESVKMQLVKPTSEKEWDLLPVVTFDPKAPIANSMVRQEQWVERSVEEFSKPRNRERWSMGPLTVNAYYSPADHKFVMLQGILQYPFYDAAAPEAANFGGAGMVVGHELGHAIDDQGAKYDENGNLKQWMSSGDIKKFHALGDVLVKQYASAGHDGRLTLGENIADVTGLSFAYEAAFPENKGKPEDKKAFFLQFARSWCGTMRPSERERRLKTDPHAQTDVRVNEPLKHQPGFYEAYGCKAGDKMYLSPANRLKLW